MKMIFTAELLDNLELTCGLNGDIYLQMSLRGGKKKKKKRRNQLGCVKNRF